MKFKSKLHGLFLKLRCFIIKSIYFNAPNIKIGYFNAKISSKPYLINNGVINIGENLSFRNGLKINVSSGTLSIKENVFFNNNISVNVKQNVEIGEYVIIGESVKIYDHDHNFRLKKNLRNRNFISSPIVIKDGAWIGSNSVILRGVTIGENCVVAAGSIVRTSLPNNSLYLDGEVKSIHMEDYND